MVVEEFPWFEPAEAAGRLRAAGGLAFLDSALPHPRLGRYSYVAADPFGLFTVETGEARWRGEALPGPPLGALRALMAGFAAPRRAGLPPFQGGAVGSLSYEFGHALLDLPGAAPGPLGRQPDAWLAFYDVVLAFDHEAKCAWLISSGCPDQDPGARGERARERAERFKRLLGDAALSPSHPVTSIARQVWRSNFTRATFEAAVSNVVESILDGEVFQANVAQRFVAELPADFDPWAFYGRLRAANPAPYAAFLDQGGRFVLSSSPELFLTLDEGRVETRPIKGTARRHADPERDRAASEALLASEKDRAENTMIVDLLRNDLSRVCRPGSVAVPSLCQLESYAGVHHLVSAVAGELRPGQDAFDLLAAAFPGGSITGAPKEQAMRVITRTEREARGAYCGSVLWLGFDGAMAANIAIRTVTTAEGQASFHAGGGVTALSRPAAEYDETLAKAERIFAAFEPAGHAGAA